MRQANDEGPDTTATFNCVADGYDSAPLRFFSFAADRAVRMLGLRPGQKMLDIAAGTGAVALSAAQRVAPNGRVFAIDLSEAMLAKLETKAKESGLSNIDIYTMDAMALDFRRGFFDCSVCSFGIFFLQDMKAALREWMRVTKPGGQVMFTAFDENAFNPMLAMLRIALARRGVVLPAQDDGTYQRLGSMERCRVLAESAGLQQVEVVTHQVGYHLNDVQDWWTIVMNAALRGFIDRLAPSQREQLRLEHLHEVAGLATADGLWLDLPVHFTCGRVPAA